MHFGSADGLKQQDGTSATLLITVMGDPQLLQKWVEIQPDLELLEMNRNGAKIFLKDGSESQISECLKRLVRDGVPVVDFHREERRLEDAFVDILKAQ